MTQKITLKTIAGKTVEIDVELSDTIKMVKEKIQKKSGFPPEIVQAIYAGKELNDTMTLKESGNDPEHIKWVIRHASLMNMIKETDKYFNLFCSGGIISGILALLGTSALIDYYAYRAPDASYAGHFKGEFLSGVVLCGTSAFLAGLSIFLWYKSISKANTLPEDEVDNEGDDSRMTEAII